MDVCFSARVSNRKQSKVTAVASQDEFIGISDQTQSILASGTHWKEFCWFGAPWCFLGKGRSYTKRAKRSFRCRNFQRNWKRQKSLEEYRDRNDRDISACWWLSRIKLYWSCKFLATAIRCHYLFRETFTTSCFSYILTSFLIHWNISARHSIYLKKRKKPSLSFFYHCFVTKVFMTLFKLFSVDLAYRRCTWSQFVPSFSAWLLSASTHLPSVFGLPATC